MSGVRVVALAARTPVGLSAEATAAAVRAGISRVVLHPMFADANGENVRCGYDAALGPEPFGHARMTALARPVLADMARALTRSRATLGTVPLLLAMPEPRPGFAPKDRRAVVGALAGERLAGVAQLDVHDGGNGHAGALAAIAEASTRIARGEWPIAVVGGVDSYLDGYALDWLEETRRLDREGIRGGFPPGEGVAMIALASDDAVRQLGLSALATVRATACEAERRPQDGPEGPLGEALTQVIARAAGALRRPHERFDDLYCDVNGERPRVTDLGFALMRTGEFFRDGTDYRTAVTRIGDVGAASGALSCVFAVRAWTRGYASGPLALVVGSSWTGLRGAVLLASGEN